MDLERERGITIKSKAVKMRYLYKGQEYELNLIDTPGHVDFTYEVSRSLAACEGALLVVDATQGVEAQTLANVYLALENDLEILPVINKIDLAERPAAGGELPKLKTSSACPARTRACSSRAKTGLGVDKRSGSHCREHPRADRRAATSALRALIFDSFYDNYRGAICHVPRGGRRGAHGAAHPA